MNYRVRKMRWPIAGFMGELSRRVLGGEDRDLVAPLQFLDPGCSSPQLPAGVVDAEARRRMAKALARSNLAFGHPEADHLCQRLGDPRTRVVVTGQQAGLLGGPLYTVIKAVAAARWAAQLEASGQPAVALFWVATEDHDYVEAARCLLPAPGLKGPQELRLEDSGEGLRPVGERRLGPQAAALCAELAARVSHPGYRDWMLELESCCDPESTFGDSFSRLMVAMLGARCPLLLDARDATLKELQRPFLLQLVERREEVSRGLAERERELVRRSFSPQVKPQPDWSPLFLIDDDGRRRRIGWSGDDGYRLRGGGEREGAISELRELIESTPQRVTPGVLARPALQDAVLGTTLFVLGPGELAYMAQAAAVHEVLGVRTALALRPQTLIVDARRREQIEQLRTRGIDLGTLLGPESVLETRLAELSGNSSLKSARGRFVAPLEDLRRVASDIDPQLKSAWERTRSQVDRALEAFDSKATAALARSDQQTRSRVYGLREICLPGGSLQERVVTAAHFPGLYGSELLATLWSDLDLDPRHLQVLTPGLQGATTGRVEVEAAG